MNNRKKILILGIDGGTFRFIDPLIKKGLLPNLEKLIDNGSYGVLNSTVPPISPAAWSTFITGKNPGAHGIYNFFDFEPNSYSLRILNSSMRSGKSIWTILNESGLKTFVMNVPFTFPPEEVDGVMISGMDTPSNDSKYYHPENIMELIEEAIADKYSVDSYITDIEGFKDIPEIELMKMFKENVYKQVDIHGKTAKYLIEKHEWDFGIAVFTSADRAQHHFWKFLDQKTKDLSETILSVYQHIDRNIGEILELCEEDTTVVVMSDHGAGPLRKACLLNNWLEEKGYLTRKKKGFNIKGLLLPYIFRTLRKIIPGFIKESLKSSLPFLKSRVANSLILADVDWEHTKAFSEGFYGNIFINKKGLRPKGIVSEDDYSELCKKIMEEALEFVDPDNNTKIVRSAYLKDEIYSGKFLDSGPDIVLLPSEGYQLVGDYLKSQHSDGKNYTDILVDIANTRVSGTHMSDGIIIMSGPGIKKKHPISDADIADIAPTLLAMLGHDIPVYMDGKVLDDIFIDKVKYNYKEQSDGSSDDDDVREYTDNEKSTVKERLKELGYMD